SDDGGGNYNAVTGVWNVGTVNHSGGSGSSATLHITACPPGDTKRRRPPATLGGSKARSFEHPSPSAGRRSPVLSLRQVL
ncbi:MAG: hypothetical protein ACM3Y9_01285, partial [Ignavibacteria bacterium]